MLKATLAGFIVSALVLVAGGGDEAAKKERAKFKGTWKITKVENAKGETDEFKGAELRFDEDGTMELKHNEETKKATYKVNPAAKPKELDIKIDEDGGKTIRGIYQFEKDKLKLCVDANPDMSERPTEFGVKDNRAILLVTLERAK